MAKEDRISQTSHRKRYTVNQEKSVSTKKKYIFSIQNRAVQRQSMLVKQVVSTDQSVKEEINVIGSVEQKMQSSHTKLAKPRRHLVHVQHYDPEDQLQCETSHHNHQEDK